MNPEQTKSLRMRLLCTLLAIYQTASFRTFYHRVSLTKTCNIKDVFYELYDAIDAKIDPPKEDFVYVPQLHDKMDEKHSFGLLKGAAVRTKDLIYEATHLDYSEENKETYKIVEKNLKFYQEEKRLEAKFKREDSFRAIKDSVWNSIDSISNLNDNISSIPEKVTTTKKSVFGFRTKIGNTFKKIRRVPQIIKNGASSTKRAAISFKNQIGGLKTKLTNKSKGDVKKKGKPAFLFPFRSSHKTETKSNTKTEATATVENHTAKEMEVNTTPIPAVTAQSTGTKKIASFVLDDDYDPPPPPRPKVLTSFVIDEDMFLFPDGERPKEGAKMAENVGILNSGQVEDKKIPSKRERYSRMIPSYVINEEAMIPRLKERYNSVIPSYVIDEEEVEAQRIEALFNETFKPVRTKEVQTRTKEKSKPIEEVQKIKFPGEVPYAKIEKTESAKKLEYNESLELLMTLPEKAVSTLFSPLYNYQASRNRVSKAMDENVVTDSIKRDGGLYERLIKFLLAPFYKYRQSQKRIEAAKLRQKMMKMDPPTQAEMEEQIDINQIEEQS